MMQKNKHKILAAGFSAMLFSIPLQSHADEDLVDYGTGFTISAIGVGTGANGTAFFDLVEQSAASKGCTWERYYINLDTPAGVSTYATLLNVYNRGKKLRRLHFFQTSNPGGCTVNLIELKV